MARPRDRARALALGLLFYEALPTLDPARYRWNPTLGLYRVTLRSD